MNTKNYSTPEVELLNLISADAITNLSGEPQDTDDVSTPWG